MTGGAATRPLLLTVAGSDPSGGAGLEADLQVFAHLGADGAAVATAWTTQDSARVWAVELADAESFGRRLDAVLLDLPFVAVKIGMLGCGATAAALAARLEDLEPRVALIVDPILAASSGTPLIDDAGVAVLCDAILPRADLATPNRGEAARLTGLDLATDPERLARAFVERTHARSVLVTGGDGPEDDRVVDVFFDGRDVERLETARVPGPSPHGTGCALSAAVAVYVGRGRSPRAAVLAARRYTAGAIANAVTIGRARGARPRLGKGPDDDR